MPQETSQLHTLVAQMGFEGERDSGEELPRGWEKSTELPGLTLPDDVKFPHYVKGQLTEELAHEGKVSFAMKLNGGNVAYTYTGRLLVANDCDYRLTGWVRTANLRAARAQVRLFMVDTLGNPIAERIIVSEPMGGPRSDCDGIWRPFQLDLPASPTPAAQLRISLGLVQPKVWLGTKSTSLWDDIDGSVWWDDLRLYRLPRVRVRTDTLGNVFAPGVQPRLKILLHGIDQTDWAIVLTVRDAAGAIRLQRIIDWQALQARGEEVMVAMPLLPAGFYVAELTIGYDGKILGSQYCRFACLAEVPRSGKTGLGADISALPWQQWPGAVAMTKLMQASEIKLSAWPTGPVQLDGPDSDSRPVDPSAELAAADRMRELLISLHAMGITPMLVFTELPAELAGALGPGMTLFDTLAADNEDLKNSMCLALARYGDWTSRWQIGRAGDARTV
ncbi:MAG: hypothetical protein HQ546_04345, partial [Planctomycetes bacterium]|nr:hypothetical protein [Planctomycetota bacterium]